jgi:hypothetical protein
MIAIKQPTIYSQDFISALPDGSYGIHGALSTAFDESTVPKNTVAI